MSIADILRKRKPTSQSLPAFVRSAEDIDGVRVLRLQGSVGKDIGPQVQASVKSAEREGDVFTRPLLLDFAHTTEWDFSTVSYLVNALRLRISTSARVGVINAPVPLISELEIAKLEQLFQRYGSEEEALADLGSAEQP